MKETHDKDMTAEPCKSCEHNLGLAGCARNRCVLEDIPPFMGTIQRFAVEMAEKMKKRAKKRSGWDDPEGFPCDQRFHRLMEEIRELIDAMKSGKRVHVRDECVDVANQIMMIWFVMGCENLPDDWNVFAAEW